MNRFNPYRVFSLVATLIKAVGVSKNEVVSIPIGFSHSLRQVFGAHDPELIRDVSIPIGFSHSLRPLDLISILSGLDRFQSLSGFLTRCDLALLQNPVLDRDSFNPYRVFSLVATLSSWISIDSYGLSCFNPYRVFSLVATASTGSARASSNVSFNPYRVFSLVATHCVSHTHTFSGNSFNPYRVFSLVATLMGGSWRWPIDSVSIPIGFSHSLRHVCRLYEVGDLDKSFNPYRVFSLVATDPPGPSRAGWFLRRFNPYRVFSLVATPYRVFSLVATLRCFNPYRVFSLVATFDPDGKERSWLQVSIPIGFSHSLRRFSWFFHPNT